MNSLPQSALQEQSKSIVNEEISPETPTKNLRVLITPWYTTNPYQEKLAEHLEQLGNHVEGSNCSTSSLLKTVNAKNVDILHLHWLQHFFLNESSGFRSLVKLIVFSIQLIILRQKNIKIVWTIHNLKNHKNQHLKLDFIGSILVSRIAHQLIVHSETAKNETMKAYYLKNSKKIHVIPHANYIDSYTNTITRSEARNILNLPDSSLVLLFFGLIHPYKGVLELVQAFKEFNPPNTYLVIAGQPKNNALAEQIQREAHAHNNIMLHFSFIPDEQVQVYMNACDAVIFPYKEFLTSGAVILAMTFGKACLAPRQGFTGEVLDESSAVLYDPQVEGSLLDAMKAIVQRNEELTHMGEKNYRRAEEWSWDRIAQLTCDVYQK